MIKIIGVLIVGFVVGVLVGRKNKALVEKGVSESKDVVAKVQAEIKK